MDDALVLGRKIKAKNFKFVLILVVMDDALVPNGVSSLKNKTNES